MPKVYLFTESFIYFLIGVNFYIYFVRFSTGISSADITASDIAIFISIVPNFFRSF